MDMPTPQRRTLYPEIEPYEIGHLDVGDGHSLYWELCGNPDGKPVVFLHGGPGGGSSPDHRRQFDPDALQHPGVRPARLRQVDALCEPRGQHDLAPGRRHRAAARPMVAKVDKWMVFGGSWGSTLALAYAQTYPERVTELVLRGIFLFDQYELDWLYKEGGASPIYPGQMGRVRRAHPRGRARRPGRGLSQAADQRRSATSSCAPPRRGASGKATTVTLLPEPEVDRAFHRAPKSRSPSPGSRTITWPTRAGSRKASCCAAPSKLRGIPGVIVQGRHDSCTPPRAAWALKKAWPEVDLQIVPDGGHLYNEPGILDGLVRATDRFANA